MPEGPDDALDLVLILHGYALGSSVLEGVCEVAQEALPEAALLVPTYPSSVLSNEDPTDIAEAVLDMIDAADAAREAAFGEPYRRIVLVGYSLGALLVRKVYVYARGRTEDATIGRRSEERPWVHRVERIVLIAGMNRGWSLKPKPSHMSWRRVLVRRVTAQIARLLGQGRLIRSVRRGSPFVTNLRIQWLELVRSGAPPPVTIQLLGTRDDLVSPDDSKDIQSGRDFVYRTLPDSGHRNAIDFSGEMGARRRAILKDVLAAPTGTIRSDPEPSFQQNAAVERVVFIIHGIRDFGHWREAATEAVERAAEQAGVTVRVIRAGYGYLPVLPFLLFTERQRYVRWLMDEYVEALAKYQNASVSYIGHSNGTYLLASALQQYRAARFDRVVFAGSIVPTRYHWGPLIPHRVGGLMNLVATGDWVVGVFPGLFEKFGWGDVGCAGHDGFADGAVQDCQIKFVKSNHSALVRNPVVLHTTAQYVLGGPCSSPLGGVVVQSQSRAVVLASKFNWIFWAVGIIVLLAAWVCIATTTHWVFSIIFVLLVFLAFYSA